MSNGKPPPGKGGGGLLVWIGRPPLLSAPLAWPSIGLQAQPPSRFSTSSGESVAHQSSPGERLGLGQLNRLIPSSLGVIDPLLPLFGSSLKTLQAVTYQTVITLSPSRH